MKKIPILIFTVLSSAWPVFAESIAIKSVQAGKISINTPEKVYLSIKDQYAKIPAGIRFVEDTLQIKNDKAHTFWFATNETEMISVLRQGVQLKEKKLILNSLRRRSYRDKSNTVILTASPPDISRMFRFVFSQVTLQFMDDSEFFSKKDSVPWFYYGFSSYMGFRAARAAFGDADKTEAETQCIDYYKKFFRGKEGTRTVPVMDSSEWLDRYKKDPEAVLSESVLAYVFFNQKFGTEKAVETFRRYNETGDFQGSFKEITGTDYGKFLDQLNKDFLEKFEKKSPEKK